MAGYNNSKRKKIEQMNATGRQTKKAKERKQVKLDQRTSPAGRQEHCKQKWRKAAKVTSASPLHRSTACSFVSPRNGMRAVFLVALVTPAKERKKRSVPYQRSQVSRVVVHAVYRKHGLESFIERSRFGRFLVLSSNPFKK